MSEATRLADLCRMETRGILYLLQAGELLRLNCAYPLEFDEVVAIRIEVVTPGGRGIGSGWLTKRTPEG